MSLILEAEIERLRAENRRLREALRMVSTIAASFRDELLVDGDGGRDASR